MVSRRLITGTKSKNMKTKAKHLMIYSKLCMVKIEQQDELTTINKVWFDPSPIHHLFIPNKLQLNRCVEETHVDILIKEG